MQILTTIGKLKVAAVSLASATMLFAGAAPLGMAGTASARGELPGAERFGDGEDDASVAELVQTGDRNLAITAQTTQDAGVVRNLQFTDLRTGAAVRLAEDPGRLIAHGQLIGTAAAIAAGRGYGYLALVEREDGPGLSGQPHYDAVFVRFSDMQRFTIARRVAALHTVEPQGRQRFAIAVKAPHARTIVFDSRTGRVAGN